MKRDYRETVVGPHARAVVPSVSGVACSPADLADVRTKHRTHQGACRRVSQDVTLVDVPRLSVALAEPTLAAVPESDEGRVRDDGAGTEQVRRNVGRRKGVVRELLRSRPI